jgi:glutaredoxin
MAKEFLDGQGIAYTNIDVSADEKAAEEMIKKSGQMGVPVIDVDGKIIIGFDKAALKEAVGI